MVSWPIIDGDDPLGGNRTARRSVHSSVGIVFLRLTVTDMPVSFPGDPASAAWNRCVRTVWCRLPAAWFDGGGLAADRRRQLAAAVCPAGTGGRFVVVGWREERLTAEQARFRPWRDEVVVALLGTEYGVLAPIDPAAFV